MPVGSRSCSISASTLALACCAAGAVSRLLAGDCNRNGIADGDEIAAGQAVDCNRNGAPDECDVAAASYGTRPGPGAKLPAGSQYYSVGTLFDWDQDGIADAAVGNVVSVEISQWRGTATGELQPWKTTPVGALQLGSFRGADLDGDGLADLIVTTERQDPVTRVRSQALERLLAAPGGGFGPPQALPLASSTPYLFTTGDLDQDGDVDIAAVRTPPGEIVPLDNDGRGAFTPAAGFGADAAADLVAADFDGDGRPDLLHLSSVAGRGEVHFGANDGTWPERRDFSVPPASFALAAGDLDGEAGLDVAVLGYPGGLLIYLSRRREELLPAPLPDAAAPFRVRIADLDRDGDQDLLTAANLERCGTVQQLWRWDLGLGDGTFASARRRDAPPGLEPLGVADFAGEGLLDLVGFALVPDQHGPAVPRIDVQLGALEPWSRDEDRDGVPDDCAADAADCNWNGTPDAIDLATGKSRDCDLDRVPDECEPDCNRNGAEDSCDLLAGTSVDRDENGVPDECQVVEGDCNENLTADWLEILEDPAKDCDQSGLLDSCESSPRLLLTQLASRRIVLSTPARDLVSGDLNGDGRPDLALALRSDCCQTPVRPGAVALLTGSAGGGFVVQGPISAAGEPDQILAGDMDADGDLDLVVQNESAPCQTSRELEVFWLAEGRGISASSSLRASRELRAIALVDVEADGDLDIAAGLAGEQQVAVSLFLNDGRGALEPVALASSASGVRTIAAGDWNRDGRSDLALGTEAPPGISILESAADGSFGEKRIADSARAPVEVHLEDLDGDGDVDLVAGTVAEVGLVELFWSDPAGVVRREGYSPRASPRTIAFLDLNGNGKADLCISGGTSESTSTIDPGFVAIGLDPALGPLQRFLGFPVRAITPRGAWADFDLDGLVDLVITDAARPELTLLSGIVQAVGVGTGRSTVEPFPVDIDAGDFDGDGDDDLALVSAASRAFSFLVQDAVGLMPIAWTPPRLPPPRALAAGDWNADDRTDLAMASDDSLVVLPNRRGLFAPGDGDEKPFTVLPLGTPPMDLLAADLDQDGDLDLATCNSLFGELDDNVSIFRNDGSGDFAPGRNYVAGRWPSSLAAVDLTEDGRLDLVTNDLHAGGLRLLVNRGGAAFLPAAAIATSRTLFYFTANDVDDDRDADFIAADAQGLATFLFTNQGDGRFDEAFVNDHGALRFAAHDLTADGLPELAVAPAYDGRLLVYQNAGAGVFRPAQTFTFKDQNVPLAPADGGQGGSGDPAYEARYAVADLNRDGKIDLAMALVQYSTVLVFHNQSAPAKPDRDHDGILDACDAETPAGFRRADPNRDARVDLSDAVAILRHLFLTGEPLPCRKEADANDDGRLDVSDAVAVLGYLYLGTDAPPPPYPGCGEDPTADELGCEEPLGCM